MVTGRRGVELIGVLLCVAMVIKSVEAMLRPRAR